MRKTHTTAHYCETSEYQGEREDPKPTEKKELSMRIRNPRIINFSIATPKIEDSGK